jgi:hypothetical protein
VFCPRGHPTLQVPNPTSLFFPLLRCAKDPSKTEAFYNISLYASCLWWEVVSISPTEGSPPFGCLLGINFITYLSQVWFPFKAFIIIRRALIHLRETWLCISGCEGERTQGRPGSNNALIYTAGKSGITRKYTLSPSVLHWGGGGLVICGLFCSSKSCKAKVQRLCLNLS